MAVQPGLSCLRRDLTIAHAMRLCHGFRPDVAALAAMLTPLLATQDGDCHARDGSCARCDRGYLPIDSFGVVVAQHGWSNDDDDDGDPDGLFGAYTCCLPQSVRSKPHDVHFCPVALTSFSCRSW